mmetsp:Transcript_21944/g.30149  ORF Transcript_21944/g.30149 Transcript_21944/m.30149 type:complete len:152 (-) Transcript_21944:272-727(-)
MRSGIHYKPSLADLKLQILLYYNVIFSIMFAVLIGSCSVQKVQYYEKKVSISVLSIWAAIEPFRLYYGFSGNLKERVPDLAAYLLISVFPQLPFVIYLAFVQPVLFPIDPIMGSLMFIFLVVQVFIGLQTIQKMIRFQTVQFLRLCEEAER